MFSYSSIIVYDLLLLCWKILFHKRIYTLLQSLAWFRLQLSVIYKSTYLEITSPWWYHLLIIQAHLLQQPPFSQHTLWQCCNHLGILSPMAEILLFDLVFHNGVTPVSISMLKPPLRVIETIPLKLWASPIVGIHI